MTIRANFLRCFAVRAVWNALQPQISVINVVMLLNLSQVSNKAASSVDKEKLLKKYFHRGYPYAALIMCTSDCGSGCFKVFIFSLILASNLLDHFTSFNCFSLVLICFSTCFPFCSEQM